MPRIWFTCSIALAAPGPGCVDSLVPEVGSPVGASCVGEDSDAARSVSFRTEILGGVWARPEIDCARCHTPGGATPFGLSSSGLDLTSFATLTAGGARSRASIVVPGQPCASILVQKLSAAPPFGARMPFDGRTYLSEADLRLVSDWIVEGANDN